MVKPGNAQLVVQWAAVGNATGYEMQWKSGGQSYNSTRQATVTPGTTTSHTITSLANGTTYTVRAVGQMRAGLAVLPGTPEVAGVDGGGDELAGVAGVRSVARAPGVAGLCAVCVGGEVAHLLEGVAPVAEVLRLVGEQLELPSLHLGAVLCGLEVLHVRHDAIDGRVEPLHLAVQHVDEAPHQGLALVGHLCAVDGDTVHHDADGRDADAGAAGGGPRRSRAADRGRR